MKKVLLLATATAVALSSLAPVVSASSVTRSFFDGTYNDTAENMGAFNVPKKDKVTVDLDMQSKWSSSDGYSDHSTQGNALSVTVSSVDDTREFDSMAYLDMTNVAKEWNAYIDAALNSDKAASSPLSPEEIRKLAVSSTKLEGTFDMVISFPRSYSSEGVLTGIDNEAFLNGTAGAYTWPENDMGYSVTDFFELESQGKVEETDTSVSYKITMSVKDGVNEALDEYFNAILSAQSSDPYKLEFEVLGNTVGSTSTRAYALKGEFSGHVDINVPLLASEPYTVYFGNDDDYTTFDTIAAETDQEMIQLKRVSGGGGGGGAAPVEPTEPGSTSEPGATDEPGSTSEPGVTDEPGSTSEPGVEHTPAPVETPGSSTGAQLNYEDHYAYIIGYDTDNGPAVVRPQNNITRAEVATIFFRMLTDDSRSEFWTQDNDYSDVNIDDWFNNAISTATNAGIVNGYDTGDFKPNAPITRAEFAAIAARFSSRDYTGPNMFNDISGHWAAESINKAAQIGWINGYDDGSFRPDAYITRAEAMTLINRVLYRLVDDDGLHEDMITWPDNTPDKWYYAAVQEATNSHYYEREDIGYYETWTEIREPRDWEALEKELSQVTDAGEEESIFFDETDIPDEAVTEAPTDEEVSASEEPTESEEPSVDDEAEASPAPSESAEPEAE